MRVDTKSLAKLMGKGKGAVFYGLQDCLYVQVKDSVEKAGEYEVYDVLDFDDKVPPFPVIDIDMDADQRGFIKRVCKAGITSVVIENYKRNRRGEPLIPIIFCVELEQNGKQTALNVDLVARKAGEDDSVTNAELRRCFKTYHEMTEDMKQIARETFKFVCVKQDAKDQDLYSLHPVPPFWEKPDWYQMWDERTKTKVKKNQPKKHQWRDVQTSEMKLFNEKHKANAGEKKKNVFMPLIERMRSKK